MPKLNCFLAVLTSALLFSACSDSDDATVGSSRIVLYDNSFNVGSGVIWQGNPYSVVNTVPYVWKDTYVNDKGETVTDDVEGFTVSDNTTQLGNYTISLYETGLTYSPELASAREKAPW